MHGSLSAFAIVGGWKPKPMLRNSSTLLVRANTVLGSGNGKSVVIARMQLLPIGPFGNYDARYGTAVPSVR